MPSIKRLWGLWRDYRRVKPVLDHIQRKDTMEKLKSRKFWITSIVGCLGVLAMGVGVPDDQWTKVSEWLLQLLIAYFGANVVEHVAGAIAKKKENGQ